MAYLGLSRRAAQDIADIERFSVARWGSKVAADYISDMESASLRLREQPDLLRARADIFPHFGFYRVRQHFLIGVVVEENVYVLAVKHGAMDLPTRLAELEPQLLRETEWLHRAFLAKSSKLH